MPSDNSSLCDSNSGHDSCSEEYVIFAPGLREGYFKAEENIRSYANSHKKSKAATDELEHLRRYFRSGKTDDGDVYLVGKEGCFTALERAKTYWDNDISNSDADDEHSDTEGAASRSCGLTRFTSRHASSSLNRRGQR
ncbi:hypothetical protein CI109_103446 [Kwoniella shandongensis]|uniref:Uncharacterized protein n=1 Tax=Kwoniella shandongensis TaxID=1734106 RepID=A0A5M6BWZ3_9TREE|nr:uncharacterized protein CI109_004526 [Kwoniella shandongensis]KAA5527233.1 hypothetical protein CI109_004526 [Kwoniella shandongensis]